MMAAFLRGLSEKKQGSYDSFYLSGKIKAEYISSVENLLDGFHTPYIHFGLVRSQKKNTVKAIIEQKESLVEIRVAFQMFEITKEINTLFSNNETIESDLTDQPEVYQAFFEQIDKELFVRKNKY